MLLEVHAELTGGLLSRHERDPASFGSVRRMWERISEALERATASGRLRLDDRLNPEKSSRRAVDREVALAHRVS